MASPYGSQIRFGPSLTPVVKNLIIVNSVFFVLQILFRSLGTPLESFLALDPEKIRSFWIWQVFTYSFLHSDFFHILFNMLALWMFGSELENYWDSSLFLRLYVLGGFLGALVHLGIDALWPQAAKVVGASGSIYALLIAYAMIWPNREILFMLVFPMKAKFFVLILMLMIAFAQGGRAAHWVHAGGALAGFLFVKYFRFFKNFLDFHFSFSRYLQKRRFQKYQQEMEMRRNSKEKVDELLDKISKYGMKSLTKKERKFLNEASKHYREE